MQYAQALVAKAGHAVKPAEIFAKILAHNDDAGRHGVVIPVAAYSFFPHLTITDPEQNATASFRVFDAFSASWKNMALKYYQRYPERRITRLNPFINKHADIPRMLVIVRATHADGEPAYYGRKGRMPRRKRRTPRRKWHMPRRKGRIPRRRGLAPRPKSLPPGPINRSQGLEFTLPSPHPHPLWQSKIANQKSKITPQPSQRSNRPRPSRPLKAHH
jgi:hypothetical protein